MTDLKICVKRHYKMEQLQQIIDILRTPASLSPQNSNHNPTGNYSGYRECHIASDWLLIYHRNDNELLLYRTILTMRCLMNTKSRVIIRQV